MSTYSTVSNYGGRQPNNTSYIKQFVQSFDDVMAWIYVTVAGTTYIEPSVTDKTILIPQSMIVEGDLTVNGTFSNPSDRALKDEIMYMGDDSVADDDYAAPFDRLQPCSYRYKREIETKGKDVAALRYGFIAQDLEKAYPNLVSVGDDGMKIVHYIDLIAILVDEVQTLKAQMADLISDCQSKGYWEDDEDEDGDVN